jgi:hypothetical protein
MPIIENNIFVKRGIGGFMVVMSSTLINGSAAPEFDVETFDGKKISLFQLRQEGPVVLVFLRGFG